uniref:DUF4216 domain-containing protein n=1 Tax=Lactuca sativa TaxID=4236 RepID=A0A9R1UZ01_LACSA|nr:hypothetical protein LSAT_V11C700384790 [Lactuca sativa]
MGQKRLIGYSDSSHNVDPDDGRSTTGHIFYHASSPITWCSQKQDTVALSSCEAEFMAATTSACQAIWLQDLLGEIMNKAQEKVILRVDNKSAIELTKNPVFHGRSKHIHTRFHFIRNCVEREQVEVENIPGGEQRADILTKPLARTKFKEMWSLIGGLMSFSTHHNQEPRNFAPQHDNSSSGDILSVFAFPSRRLHEKGGKKILLKHEELHKAHTYILLSYAEVAPFIPEFDRAAQASYQNEPISVLRDKYFAEWFKYKVTRDSTDGSAKHLEPLANGPSNNARSYNGYFVNGYKFHTQEYGKGRATNNYGLCVRGEIYNGEESDYYGLLDEILEIDYYGIGCSTVVLFKCTWFDNIRGVVVNKNKLVDVKPTSRIQTNDPFCLASQAEQVFYTPYPAVTDELKDLWAVVKTKPRGVYEVTEAETEVALDGSTESNGVFHLDERFELPNEVNVSERLSLAMSDKSLARNLFPVRPSSGGRPSSLPDRSGLQRIPLTGGSLPGARSSPLPDPSGLPRIHLTGGSVPGANSSPFPDPSGLPRGGFVSGARSSPSPNGLPRIPLSSGLSRTSVRTTRSGFSGSSRMGDINTNMGLTDAIVDTGVVQNVGNGIAYGYEMTGNNEDPASDFFYNGPEHENEPEHGHESMHEPESPMVQTPHYSGTHGGSNDVDSNGSHRPFITRKGYK